MSALPPTVSVPSEALKAFIKSTSEIVAEAMEADVKIDAELELRWLKAAGELQKAVEGQVAPKVLEDCPATLGGWLCTLDKGHTGDHEAHGSPEPMITWPQ